jgi:hypothetical protein
MSIFGREVIFPPATVQKNLIVTFIALVPAAMGEQLTETQNCATTINLILLLNMKNILRPISMIQCKLLQTKAPLTLKMKILFEILQVSTTPKKWKLMIL